MSFSLSLIIFDFFLMTLCLMNRLNQFLITGLIFFILCSSNLSISSLDTIISMLNSSSISFLIFSFLSFNSIPFNSVKSFSNSKDYFLLLKIDYFAYFLSIFSQYFRYYGLGFPSLYIHKIFLKFFENKNIVFKQFLNNSILFCYSNYSFLYIFTNTFWKIYENEILYFKLFCPSDFPFLYIHNFFFEKIHKNKILYFKLFVTQISPPYIFMKIFWKTYENKILYFFRVIPSYLLLRFSFLIYFWKSIEKCLKTKCCINLIFWIMSSYLVAWIFLCYIFLKFYWKIYGNKLFCCLNFPFLYISEYLLKDLWKQNIEFN